LIDAWNPKFFQGWKPCVDQTIFQVELPKRNGFLIIEANCGLSQQRLSICDAVAVAGLLNATLVIPIFHLNSVWRDSRCNIFDEEFFIYALRNHVDVVRVLPELILQQVDNNISNIVNLRVKAWSSPTYNSKGANRVDVKCPLTRLEVGMMLRGMGFDNSTSLYAASGKIYKAENHMAH
ncbi:O-fucosyltransferase 9 isoform X2, partial [Olea europaea subsp. europaea]